MRGNKRDIHGAPPLKLTVLGGRKECGISSVGEKCIDIEENPDCKGSFPAPK